MMSLKLQIVICIMIVLLVAYIISQVCKKRIDFRFALGWLVIGAVILVLTIWPQTLEWIAYGMGIVSPVNMLFFFGFCFSLYMIFSLSTVVSHQAEKIKKMSQEIAIMKKGIHKELDNSEK